MSDSVRSHRWQPTRLPRPWDSPGKNIGVGCHFLLQCMKGKRESEVPQSCLTLRDPMDCSPPGSSAHGSFQARVLEWVASALSEQSPGPATKVPVVITPHLPWGPVNHPFAPSLAICLFWTVRIRAIARHMALHPALTECGVSEVCVYQTCVCVHACPQPLTHLPGCLRGPVAHHAQIQPLLRENAPDNQRILASNPALPLHTSRLPTRPAETCVHGCVCVFTCLLLSCGLSENT